MPEKYSLLEHLLFPPKSCDAAKLSASLQGKTVLITGASFGIGESLAYLLSKNGANLILVARTAEKLEAIKNEIKKNKLTANVSIFSCDLTKDKEVQSLINDLQNLPGGIDIFVSNAGKSIRRPLFESLERFHDFERTMALNYFAPVKLMLGLIPILKEKHGHVINISAVNVLLIPAPFWTAYQSSKTAFDQWFRAAAPELEAAGIATTSVYLPLVRTRMIEPTAEYKNAPAMSPGHVAKIVCRSIYSRRKIFKPWWLIFGQIGSLMFHRPAEYVMKSRTKKRLE